MSYTKGPWVNFKTSYDEMIVGPGHDIDPYQTKAVASGNCYSSLSIDNPHDRLLILASPELYEALKKANKVIAMFIPNIAKCYNIDFQLLNECGIEVTSLLTKLKEIE